MIEQDILKSLQERAYKSEYKPPPEEIILTIDNKICGSTESIVCFSGLPKAGKSSFLTACISSAFTPFPIFKIKITPPKKRDTICYIDTESSSYDFYKNMDRIKTFLELNEVPKKLNAFCFRDLNNTEIREAIECYLQHQKKCSVLFIDGLLDLLLDYNDPTESRMCINWLKKITAVHKILIIGVVHTGKSNNQTLGTFGSMIDRYCQTVLSVEKNTKENTFELTPKFLRSDGDFDKIAIRHSNGRFILDNTF